MTDKHSELRKSFTKKEINKLIIYGASQISMVVGEVEVEKVIYKPIKNLQRITKDSSCVDKKFFDEYFKGKEYQYVLKLRDPYCYPQEKTLEEYNLKKPPQNYCFINGKQNKKL